MSTPRNRAFNVTLTALVAATVVVSACSASVRYQESAAYMGGTPMPEPAPTNTEDYTDYGVNGFTDPARDNLSTFAVDVDTGSYTISRRKLNEGALPPVAAVRVEEFVNYFKYDYPQPDGDRPFTVDFEAAPSPFSDESIFLRVGVQGIKIEQEERPPVHLTFLVDTSGSMGASDKLPLLQKSLAILVNNLDARDTVALSTYAGSVREVLPPTSIREREKILDGIDNLRSGGSTAMSSGLQLAYKLAYKNFQPGHVNRVIVCSDGDANVGATDHGSVLDSIKHYTQEGVTLSTIGFGMGNYKDTMMEQLANKGNGNYYYIDTLKQARRVFEKDLMGTLVVIAKDVKIQVEFEPEAVASYRLIGYENRDVADDDFRDDAVDGGEIGSGHSVTALYEVKLKPGSTLDPAKVAVRYKDPEGGKAAESTFAFTSIDLHSNVQSADRDFRMALSVAAFAEKLRGSPHAEGWSLRDIRDIAAKAARDREDEQELVKLIDQAIALTPEAKTVTSQR